GRATPGERDLEQCDAEAYEVLTEQPLARRGGELRETQLEVAPCGSDESDRQAAQELPQQPPKGHDPREWQQRHQTEQPQPGPREPVVGREQPQSHCTPCRSACTPRAREE